MLELKPWTERIRGTYRCRIETATDIEAAQEGRSFPAIVLVPGRDVVKHAGMHPNTRHTVVSEVMMITGVSRNHRRGETQPELNQIRQAALSHLINWMPPGGDTAVLWNGGQLLKLNSQVLYWVDVLSAELMFESTTETTP